MNLRARAWTRRALEIATGVSTWIWTAAGATPARAAVDPLAPPARTAHRDGLESAEPRGSFGLLGGATLWDPRLDDYQWSVTPRAAWGAQALVGSGPYSGGMRLWRAQSRQQIDPNGASSATTVHGTSVELVGRRRLASRWGAAVSAGVSAGLLRLDYAPDHATVSTGSGQVEVQFQPIHTWVAGFGLAVEHSFAGPWTAALAMDQRVFALEAAHRNGDQIEVGRERFVDWSARLELSRLWGRR